MSRSGTLRFVAIVGVVLVVSLGTSWLVTRGGSGVRAFTLHTEVYGYHEGQPPRLRRLRKMAMRSDGTRATVGSLFTVGQTEEYERTVAFLDGSTVSFRPGIAAKTSFGARPRMAQAWRARLFNPPPNCLYPGSEFVGRDTIAGEPVVIVKLVSELGWSLTSWKAPGLGCEPLQYRSYDKQPDGTYKLTSELRTTSLVFGEPDPQLFEIPSSGYKEMKPSDIVRAYDKKYGHILENENMQLLDAADKNYFGTLRPESSIPKGR